MKHLIIIGARGWGREVYAAAIHTQAYRNGDYDVKGFLDSKADAFDGLRGNYPPIICAPEDYQIQPNDIFFVAMGEPQWRKHYAELMEAKGAHFMSIISDGALINLTAEIGDGSFVASWTSVSDNVTLGKHTLMHSFTAIGHDTQVGDYTSIYTNVFIGGNVTIGRRCNICPKSMIIPHKKIGDDVVVASASVVMRNVPDMQHVMGNPAKKIEF